MLSPLRETEKMIEAVGKHGIKCRLEVFHGFGDIPRLMEKAHSGKINGKGVVIIDEKQTMGVGRSITAAL